MKLKFFWGIFLVIFVSCQSSKIASVDAQHEKTLNFEKDDHDEYDIVVLDTGYDMFLQSIAKPMNYYSESYYKNKNQFYVMEWNLRHSQPMVYVPDFYAVRIDYEDRKEYGIKLEYKLYNFFQFIKWKYKINLDIGG